MLLIKNSSVVPVTVVVKLVVAGVGQVDPESRPHRVEDLDGGINPDLALLESLQVRHQVEVDPVRGSRQHQTSYQEDEQQGVRHGSSNPNHFA